MPNAEQECRARDALRGYLFHTRGESWIPDEERPEAVIHDRPAYDFHLREKVSKREAALEVTTFEWPMIRTTRSKKLASLARQIEEEPPSSLRGMYSLGVNTNTHRSNPDNVRKIRDWLVENGEELTVGELIDVPGVRGVNVMRLENEGPFRFRLHHTNATTEYPNWMNDLEDVMDENARKFDGVSGVHRWLLVIYPGVKGSLDMTGPTLRLPTQIDELFFIDYWPPVVDRIVEYAKVQAPRYVGQFDRETGAIRIKLPFFD